jgi:hypothetical protein
MSSITSSSYTMAFLGSIVFVAIMAMGGGQSNPIMLGNQNANAQLTGSSSNNTLPDSAGNDTIKGMMMGGPMDTMMNRTNITSSISLIDTITTALESKINVSLSEAAANVENSLGNNSHAVAAHLGDENGYLVYNVMALAPDRSFNRVLVDPGNGEVLLSEQISKEEPQF